MRDLITPAMDHGPRKAYSRIDVKDTMFRPYEFSSGTQYNASKSSSGADIPSNIM